MVIVWFRNDLRLADHAALHNAVRQSEAVLPVYIHAPEEDAPWAAGAASRWWLHASLAALDEGLRAKGSRLLLRRGSSVTALRMLARETGARRVLWNRAYEPAGLLRDQKVTRALQRDGLEVETMPGNMLFEPTAIGTAAGAPYRVFTPFWRQCLKHGLDDVPLPAPDRLVPPPGEVASLPLAELDLLPVVAWDTGLRETWQAGESAARARLETFLETGMAAYPEQRDLPGAAGTTRLSPHLHFGEISPRQIAAAVNRRVAEETGPGLHAGAEVLLRELGWREFACHILFHFPHTTDAPLNERFAAFPWRPRYQRLLSAWQRGETGCPIVDAGMRELWHTGWMHNRVRMIVASFLTKNCRIPWLQGARWFWDTLVDADLASNSLNWQWVAGCGADAAPFFRIFNPVLQGEKFDSGGTYVRRWVPELAALPDRYLHRPWQAPAAVQKECGVRAGADYPAPVLDLKESREEALAAFRSLGGQR